MTRRELNELLVDVPDDAEVFVMGTDISVVAYNRESGHVVLDEKAYPFKGGGWTFLLGEPEAEAAASG
jgi:hypothetical protein